MTVNSWKFGALIGPTPPFDLADKNGDFSFVCRYTRQCAAGTESREVHFWLKEQSRLDMNQWATAEGVDKLLQDLIRIKQSNLAQSGWDPGDVTISGTELGQLYKARECDLLETSHAENAEWTSWPRTS